MHKLVSEHLSHTVSQHFELAKVLPCIATIQRPHMRWVGGGGGLGRVVHGTALRKVIWHHSS